MRNSNAIYQSLVGPQSGARRLHVHETVLNDALKGWGAQHEHVAEEAVYMLEGEGEFTFGGQTHRAAPGQVVFFPSGIRHAEVKFSQNRVRYLVMRTVEDGDPACCCEAPEK